MKPEKKQKNIRNWLTATAAILGIAGFIVCYTAASTEDFRDEATRYNQTEALRGCADKKTTKKMALAGGVSMLGAVALLAIRNKKYSQR